jgi:hypothetical protein
LRSYNRLVGVGLVGLGLIVAAACRRSASDNSVVETATVTLEAAGESPSITRTSYGDGKLRIVARAGDRTQTRVYAVKVSGPRVDMQRTSDGMDVGPAAMSLTLGPHGEIVEPRHKALKEFASSAEYAAYEGENSPDLQAARNEQRWLFAPLPSEPIGVGARWRFEQDHYGIVGRMHQVIRYEVVRRDASELELRVQVDATSKLGHKLHANGTVVLPIGNASKLPRGSLEFANDDASGTLEMTPIE